MGKNKTIPGGLRTVILRVHHYFEEERRNGKILLPLEQVLKRTCAATGVSLSTVTRIKREEQMALHQASLEPFESEPPSPERTKTSADAIVSIPTVKLTTPGKHRPPPANKHEIDDATICAIRNIIEELDANKEETTLRKILAKAKADLNFPGQRETLRKIVVDKLGYTFKKCPKTKMFYAEKPKIVECIVTLETDTDQ